MMLSMTNGMIEELTVMPHVHRTVVDHVEDKQMATWFIIQVMVSAHFLVTCMVACMVTCIVAGYRTSRPPWLIQFIERSTYNTRN